MRGRIGLGDVHGPGTAAAVRRGRGAGCEADHVCYWKSGAAGSTAHKRLCGPSLERPMGRRGRSSGLPPMLRPRGGWVTNRRRSRLPIVSDLPRDRAGGDGAVVPRPTSYDPERDGVPAPVPSPEDRAAWPRPVDRAHYERHREHMEGHSPRYRVAGRSTNPWVVATGWVRLKRLKLSALDVRHTKSRQ